MNLLSGIVSFVVSLLYHFDVHEGVFVRALCENEEAVELILVFPVVFQFGLDDHQDEWSHDDVAHGHAAMTNWCKWYEEMADKCDAEKDKHPLANRFKILSARIKFEVCHHSFVGIQTCVAFFLALKLPRWSRPVETLPLVRS